MRRLHRCKQILTKNASPTTIRSTKKNYLRGMKGNRTTNTSNTSGWLVHTSTTQQTTENYVKLNYLDCYLLESSQNRMAMILERSKLVRQIQQHHNELSELTATLDLMKLRTFPTLDAPSQIHFVHETQQQRVTLHPNNI